MGILEDERSDLRKELQFLKDCQFKYFSVAVTVSGVMSGVVVKLPSDGNEYLAFLSPLLVVLPCWIVFFDKATTITRMVGYLTVLENIIVQGDTARSQFVGWENSVFLFREQANSSPRLPRLGEHLKGIVQGLLRLLLFRSAHRYWVFCWLTFFGLGAVSLYLSHSANPPNYSLSLALVLFGLTCIQTLGVLGNLINGMYSYSKARERWLQVLSKANAEALATIPSQG
jgi:hypothetical protein